MQNLPVEDLLTLVVLALTLQLAGLLIAACIARYAFGCVP
jgi:hypothetical protein